MSAGEVTFNPTAIVRALTEGQPVGRIEGLGNEIATSLGETFSSDERARFSGMTRTGFGMSRIHAPTARAAYTSSSDPSARVAKVAAALFAAGRYADAAALLKVPFDAVYAQEGGK